MDQQIRITPNWGSKVSVEFSSQTEMALVTSLIDC